MDNPFSNHKDQKQLNAKDFLIAVPLCILLERDFMVLVNYRLLVSIFQHGSPSDNEQRKNKAILHPNSYLRP
jgi:hypothetical protein